MKKNNAEILLILELCFAILEVKYNIEKQLLFLLLILFDKDNSEIRII